ncbi:MAG TPA: rod shape-determining protein MreC [Thermoleophilaceae bacterium]|nr:rod shape-determining protein MreC [Thermoleophilaceae bacterium]
MQAQDQKVVRRRRAVFALLVVLSVVILTSAFGGSGPFGTIANGVQAILQPIESGVSTVFKPIRDAAGWVSGTLDAQDENEELRAEVEQLREELANAQRDARDAEDLRAVTELQDESYQEAEAVTARVIGQSATAWYSTVQIDAGADQGIELDDPVTTGGGLAGKITDVTGGTATVTLITDEESAVSAEVMPSGARGVLKPQVASPEDLLLDFLDSEQEIEEGDTVITSGTASGRFESLFPRGIPIGEVSRVDPAERELYQRVHVDPHADLRSLNLVQVLVGGPSQETASVAP